MARGNVYSNQVVGAAHSECWSEYVFSKISHKNTKKMKKEERARSLKQNTAKHVFLSVHPNAGRGFYSQKNTLSEVKACLQFQKGT